MCAKLLQSCTTLSDPMDLSLTGSSVHGILQARILEWVAVPSSRDLPYLRIKPMSLMFLASAGRFFTINATWEAEDNYIYIYIHICVCVCVCECNVLFNFCIFLLKYFAYTQICFKKSAFIISL